MERLGLDARIDTTLGSRRRWFTVLLLAVLPVAASAQFSFVTNNNAITITGYSGTNNNVVIPGATNGYPVVSIGDRAFFNGQGIYNRLTGITIPDSVTNIGNLAFCQLLKVTNISLGAGVVAIGANAFQACASLTNIFLPASVVNIGNQAFTSCQYLTTITVDPVNPVFSSAGGVLYDRNQAALIECPGGLTGTFAVPNTVTSIGSSAFANCAGITNIAIPASVTNIGFEAFKICARLAAIVVDTNNPAYSSQNGVLFDQSGATLIQYPIGLTGAYTISGGVTSIANEAFYDCTNLTGVVIPAGVASIGNSAFFACTKLASATFPTSLTNIGDHAFYDCPGLTSAVTLGDNLRNLGDFAFYFCLGLPSVSVGNGITTIGNSVFYECSGLASVTLGNSVTSIGPDAFAYCGNLTSFTFPAGVTNIGVAAFLYCTKLATVTIPAGITGIAIEAFQNCSALKSVVLPSGLTSIGVNAFVSSGLTNVVIPPGVTNIGVNAFNSCASLKTVFFEGNAPASVAGSTFQYSAASTVYELPGTTGWTAFTTATGLSVTAWLLPNPAILNFEPSFGIHTNQFGFTISWATNTSVVVEACANLANPVWLPVSTNTLTSGTAYFSDAQWTNYPGRYYRLRSP
jgi:hypothetical protein